MKKMGSMMMMMVSYGTGVVKDDGEQILHQSYPLLAAGCTWHPILSLRGIIQVLRTMDR